MGFNIYEIPLGGITRNDVSIVIVHSRSAARRDALDPVDDSLSAEPGRVREKGGEIPHACGGSPRSSRDDAEPTTPTRRSSHSRPIVLNWEGTFLKPYRTACRNAATIGFRTAGGAPDIWLANENFNNSANSFFLPPFFFFNHRPSRGPSQSRADKWRARLRWPSITACVRISIESRYVCVFTRRRTALAPASRRSVFWKFRNSEMCNALTGTIIKLCSELDFDSVISVEWVLMQPDIP